MKQARLDVVSSEPAVELQSGRSAKVSELERLYWEERNSLGEVAEELGYPPDAVKRLMIKAGIDRRTPVEGRRLLAEKERERKPYTDEDTLRELYHEKGMSLKEVGEKFDVGPMTISRWMEKNGIERRLSEYDIPVWDIMYRENGKQYHGYPIMKGCGSYTFPVHLLVAIADGADPHKVFGDRSTSVHHRNGFKIDNRPENVELVDNHEHAKFHANDNNAYWYDDDMKFVIRAMLDPRQLL